MTDQPAITVDGHAIPLLGFGTWMLEPADARAVCLARRPADGSQPDCALRRAPL
jgi:hypothetical protein